MQEEMTIEQIRDTIKAARDSVHVINKVLEQLAADKPANQHRKGDLQRNVGHLKIIVAKQEIIDSGEDIQDLLAAIAAGKAKLAEKIWVSEE
jgi:hypothetical protein